MASRSRNSPLRPTVPASKRQRVAVRFRIGQDADLHIGHRILAIDRPIASRDEFQPRGSRCNASFPETRLLITPSTFGRHVGNGRLPVDRQVVELVTEHVAQVGSQRFLIAADPRQRFQAQACSLPSGVPG